VPPPDASAAQIAIGAADSALGSPYVWGTAGPDTFDCSGLTSWAYAQAGVYLPHSSAAQASSGAVVPSLSEAQPGDLLFFYSPISHVSLYVGGGAMIHARHPGPGGEVQYGSVAGYGTPVVKIVRPT
jgi:cell wall-associated NlpC family hydrolase